VCDELLGTHPREFHRADVARRNMQPRALKAWRFILSIAANLWETFPEVRSLAGAA